MLSLLPHLGAAGGMAEHGSRKQPLPAAIPAAERRPAFHMAPACGWINDPNGPLLHKDTYHLFYQHVPHSAEWQWGLVWGHAVSKDLVTWRHLPVALEPDADGPDRHGCFSGCATVDADGTPTMLFTGVVRKAQHELVPGVSPQHESQLMAVAADPDDPDLTCWTKLPVSVLPHPPASMDLTGWRDPFVLESPSTDSPWWRVMVGAGVREQCGTALVYRSRDLKQGWEYVGPLCATPASFMWECPILAHLTTAPPSNGGGSPPRQRHMLAVAPDYCVNMIVYWLGDYAAGRFDLGGACGPHPLDLGDAAYAPNVLTDKQGRTVMWAWMQEKAHLRPPGTYSSSSCLCVPRVLTLSADGSRLLQAPLPELRQLRQQEGAWHVGAAAGSGGNGSGSSPVLLRPREPLPVPLPTADGSSSSSSVDLELQVARGGAESFVLLLHPWAGVEGAAGAAVAYCWRTNTLQVINSTDLATLECVAALPLAPRPHYTQPGPDPTEAAAAAAAAAGPGMPSRCGGVLHGDSSISTNGTTWPPKTIALRVLVDGSCLEVFTGCGKALGTRVYRGDEPPVRLPPAAAAAAAAAAAEHAQDAVIAGRGAPSPAASAPAAAAATAASPAAAQAAAGGQLELVSFGPGAAHLLCGSAWQMRSMWREQQEGEDAPATVKAATAVVLPVQQLCVDVAAGEAARALSPSSLLLQGGSGAAVGVEA